MQSPTPPCHLSQTQVMTPEVLGHVTVGRSCDQTGSKSSHDLSRDQAPKQALTLSYKESEDKERCDDTSNETSFYYFSFHYDN